MDTPPVSPPRRRGLLAKFTGASLIGFVFSAATLHFGLVAGLPGWAARLMALLVAMHVTFFINGRFVFRALTRERFLGLWAAYVANSAVGNSCNFLIFMGLRSMHRPVISNAYVAFLAGAVAAWAINFLGARFVVFGNLGRRLTARARAAFSRSSSPGDPAPAEPGSSRR